jgi:hypothetical protein
VIPFMWLVLPWFTFGEAPPHRARQAWCMVMTETLSFAGSPDDMVVAAIISLQDPIGSHQEDIMSWIEARTLHILLPCHSCLSHAPCAQPQEYSPS